MRKIVIPFNDKTYTLGFTLATIEQMERNGFIIGEIGDKFATRSKELFYGAFAAYHKGIKRKDVDEIYSKLRNKESLIEALIELYGEAADALLEEGNVDWTISE
jgi:hypothetical protein